MRMAAACSCNRWSTTSRPDARRRRRRRRRLQPDGAPELFSLVVGGYGLFGVIYAATLRLAPRVRVRRMVDVIDLDDAMNAIYRRVRDGCLYGDFQFVIDPTDDNFLQRGVFACYLPAKPDDAPPDAAADLAPGRMAEAAQARARRQASGVQALRPALRRHRRQYLLVGRDADEHVPAGLRRVPAKHARRRRGLPVKETLVIGEHYVPRDAIKSFMLRAREILRRMART